MQRYFTKALPRQYPGWNIVDVHIRSLGSTPFKMSLRYDLVLRKSGAERIIVLMGNVPSLDTTKEIGVAYQALSALWRRSSPAVTIPHPLIRDNRLRALFYEAVPGRPLTSLILRQRPQTTLATERAGQWLAALHHLRLPVGRKRTLPREQQEALYFTMNYEKYYPPCVERAKALLHQYFVRRKKLSPFIERSAVLIHGDFNPNNVIVDEDRGKVSAIDFGNAWRFDPLFDFANAVVQFELLNWQFGVSWPRLRRLLGRFTASYTAGRKLAGIREKCFSLFLAWWSLQTLSYNLSIHEVTGKRPMIFRSLRRAEDALRYR